MLPKTQNDPDTTVLAQELIEDLNREHGVPSANKDVDKKVANLLTENHDQPSPPNQVTNQPTDLLTVTAQLSYHSNPYETYRWFEAKDREGFTKARTELADASLIRDFGNVRQYEYRNSYSEISAWATSKSVDPPGKNKAAIQRFAKTLSYFTSVDIEDSLGKKVLDDFLEYLKSPMHNTWENNVWLLHEVFSKYTSASGVESNIIKLPCFTMWQDGVNSLLRIINNHNEQMMAAALAAVARETDQKLSLTENYVRLAATRINTLADCFKLGKRLQLMIYQVGLSKEFFKSIFDDYLKLLDKIKTFTEQNQNSNQCLSNKEIVKGFANANTREVNAINGNLVWFSTKLKTCMLLINQYVEMVFGYQLQTLKQFRDLATFTLQFDSFLETLASEAKARPEGKTLSGRVKIYSDAVKLFLENIFYHIESAQDLVALQYYLETYHLEHPTSTVLGIDNTHGKLSRRGLSLQALDLISQFLSVNTAITTLEFNKIVFDPEHLEYLVKKLKGAMHVKGLGLVAAGLDAAALPLLKPLPANLTSLNLSNNPHLFADGVAELSLILSSHLKLQELFLAKTGLTSQQLLAFIDNKHNLKNLKLPCLRLLDISYNQLLTDDAISYAGLLHLFKPMLALEELLILGTINSTKTKEAFSIILTTMLPKLVKVVVEEAPSKELGELLATHHKRIDIEAKLDYAPLSTANQECKAVKLMLLHHSQSATLSTPITSSSATVKYDLTLHLKLGQPALDDTLIRLGETIHLLNAEIIKLQTEQPNLTVTAKNSSSTSASTTTTATTVTQNQERPRQVAELLAPSMSAVMSLSSSSVTVQTSATTTTKENMASATISSNNHA